MNRTANKTTITISTTDAKQANNSAIKKRFERDTRTGRPRVVEAVKGIRI